MRTVLFIDNSICSNLEQLKEYFIESLSPNSPIYEEILTLYRDGVLTQWLSEGNVEEKKIAEELNQIPLNLTNNELLTHIINILCGSNISIAKHSSKNFMSLKNLCLSSGNSLHDFIDNHLIIENFRGSLIGTISITFSIDKIDNEIFDFQLVQDGVELNTQYKVCINDKQIGQIVKLDYNIIVEKSGNHVFQLLSNGTAINSFNFYLSENETIFIENIPLKMIYVKGGTFTMGTDDWEGEDNERPAHKVTLYDFKLCETVVTQELWVKIMGNNPSFLKSNELPVVCISWSDCQLFIERLNSITQRKFRLPTEAEWEFAARGGLESKNYKYSGDNDIDVVGWYCANSGELIHPVKQKKPNELGFYDMNGNIEEWCYDKFGFYKNETVVNPTGDDWGEFRVTRGGSFSDDKQKVRITARSCNCQYSGLKCCGLRLAL